MANTKITSRVIADNAVTSSAIADGAITASKIASDAIDIVADTTPQLGGNLDVNGNAITGSTVQINGAGGDLMISATENGPVALRYDNNLKLTTKSDGVDITGELQSDSLDVDGDADISGTIALGNLTIAGAQGTDGQVLTSTGSGIAWEDAAGGGVAGIVSSADATAITIDSNETVDITTGLLSTNGTFYYGSPSVAQVSANRNPTTGAIPNASNSSAYLNLNTPAGSSSMEFVLGDAVNTQPSTKMTILGNGNVGIGTTSPDRVLEVSHDLTAHTPALRLTGTSASAYAAGLEWYTGFGPKQTTIMYSTANGSQGAEFWMEHRNQDSNSLKRVWHISNTARHTFHGQHNGDSTGHFLFTNSVYDAASTNCTLAVQNGGTFIQIMGWTTLGARIGTRTGGWNSNSGGDVYLTRNDATSIKLASSAPQLSNGTAISSDERLKENITNISDGQLAKINALTPRNFTWKDPRKTGTHEGFIAQEVEAVIPEAVYEDNWAPDPDDNSRDFEGDIKLIKHEVINARLIKAVQELSAKLEAAEERITTLENS